MVVSFLPLITKSLIFALMRFLKALLPTCICLLLATIACAQPSSTKRGYTRNKHNYRAPVVGHHKAKTICPIFENSKYPYQGVGFKMGDPFAFTYKLYPRKNLALAADLGVPSSGLYSRQFREEFQTKSSELVPGLQAVQYQTHKVKSDLVAELKFLYQVDADKLSEGLQVYTGVGLEFRTTKIRYDFTYEELGSPEPESKVLQRTTQGIEGVVGIEYAYFQLPISAFMEMEYFVDLAKYPGAQHFQGGIGLRYVF